MSRPLSAALRRQSGPGGHAVALRPPPGLISRLWGDRRAALPSRRQALSSLDSLCAGRQGMGGTRLHREEHPGAGTCGGGGTGLTEGQRKVYLGWRVGAVRCQGKGVPVKLLDNKGLSPGSGGSGWSVSPLRAK